MCLPLTTDIGNSIYRYILEEQPKVNDDHVFLRSQAPFMPLSGHSTCYCIVSNILQRAGIQKDDRIWGMCMLRHNAASTMVQNSIPLATIAAILGHAGTRTTDIYGNTAGPFRERRGPAVWLSPCELLFLQNICLANLISIYFPRVIILKNDLRCNFLKIIQIYRCV